jgi:hypothetical protein
VAKVQDASVDHLIPIFIRDHSLPIPPASRNAPQLPPPKPQFIHQPLVSRLKSAFGPGTIGPSQRSESLATPIQGARQENICKMASMNFSSGKQFVKPPQRGIFPLDHDAECKPKMQVSGCICESMFVALECSVHLARYWPARGLAIHVSKGLLSVIDGASLLNTDCISASIQPHLAIYYPLPCVFITFPLSFHQTKLRNISNV